MKPTFDTLEADVNEWLDNNPAVQVDHTDFLCQPTTGWSHMAIAIWYTNN